MPPFAQSIKGMLIQLSCCILFGLSIMKQTCIAYNLINYNRFTKIMHNTESKNLWIGDLQIWMDEAFLKSLVSSLGFADDLVSLRIIKDKATGLPAKYGFLQFKSHEIAAKIFQNYNGKPIPGTNKTFKMNWAAYGGGNKPSTIQPNKNTAQQMSVYVGVGDSNISQTKLLEFFQSKYPSAFMAKLITDSNTKTPKGYGFVKFSNHQEAYKAISELNGTIFEGKTIKVSNAYLKNKEQNEKQQNVEGQTAISQIQKLYQQYYKMMNDEQLKKQYQKQMEKTFSNQVQDKNYLKQNLQTINSLTYPLTMKSQSYLEGLPKQICYKAKMNIQTRIFE